MALASTSLVQIRFIAENPLTPGTTPTTGQNYDLRVTGESFDFAIQKEISKEINANRVTSSESPVAASSTGGFQSELSYNEYDAILAALFQSAWVAHGTLGVGAQATTMSSSATTLTQTGGTSWATLKKGQWFLVDHPSTANDGRLLRVSTIAAAPTATVINLDVSTPGAVYALTSGGAVRTSRLSHGTTQISFSFERQATDVGQYMVYKGQTPSKLSLNTASGSLSTMSVDFMGLGVARSNSTNLTGSTNNPSLAYGVHSSVSNPNLLIWEGGAPVAGTYVKTLALEFDNAMRQQNAIASLAPVSIASGTIMAKATLSVYFANGTLFDKFLNNVQTSLIWASLDSAGNGYVFTAPVANVSSYKVVAGSKDQDLMAEVTMTLLADQSNTDATLRKVLFIDRVGVAVTR